MNMLGEVVFCVDCDRARLSHLQSIPAGTADPRTEPPRRMAIKQDANRDPLCASCLDSRQARRRAQFMLHDGRAPILESQPSVATTPSAPRKRVEFVRIVRTRPQEPEVVPAPTPTPRKKRATQKVKTQRVSAPPKRSANGRAVERQFLMLVLEVGFLRTQELLDELKRSARNKTARSRR